MAVTVSINASARPTSGKGPARRARKAGMIPAIVYRSGQAATTVQVNPEDLERSFSKTQNRNTLISLELDGDKRLCLVKEAQRHPVSRRLVHVDFYQVDPNANVVVEVPVRPQGKSEGERQGGLLRVIRRTLPVSCRPEHIPDGIDVDVNDLDVNKYIKASMIPHPPNSKILFRGDFNVIGIIGKQKLEQDIAAALAKPEPTAAQTEAAAAAAAETAEGTEGAEAGKAGDEKGGDKDKKDKK